MKKWNKEDYDNAVDLVQKGHSYEEIGIKLNRTPRSIREKLSRNGYNSYQYYDVRYRESIICLNCGKTIIDLKNNNRVFCSHSCSATYNNKYKKKKKTIKTCLNCGKEVKVKYCDNNCQYEYEHKKIFESIENGTFNLPVKYTESRWVKKYLIIKNGEKCMECGWNEKNLRSGNIPIQIEHINGDSRDNNLNNVKLLCPNCHSLTPTFGSLNKGNGRDYRRMYEIRLKNFVLDKLISEKQKLNTK